MALKQKLHPKVQEVMDKIKRADEAFDRWFAKAKRAIKAMEKAKLSRARLDKRLQELAAGALEVE